MNKKKLTELLDELAQEDLSPDSDISDHPCSVAIRAVTQCFEDIELLKSVINGTAAKGNKSVQYLLKLSYDPSW